MRKDILKAIQDCGVTEGMGDAGRLYDIQQHPVELARFLAEMDKRGVYTVLELGTGRKGGLARFMAEYMGWKVTSVDIVRPEPMPVSEFYCMTTEQAFERLKDRRFDLIIIDADHTYEAVVADYILYRGMGCIIAFHDVQPGWQFGEGAGQFWQELIADTTLRYGEFFEPGGPGIGIIETGEFAAPVKPLISAIVSVYNSRKFLRGHLDDLLGQTIADRLEIICINSGSKHPEDAAVLDEYARAHDNVKVINTKREPIYCSWNIGIQAARGEYLTNSNTDDRHAPWALEKLIGALEKEKGDLAFSNYYCVTTPNATWDGDWQLFMDDPINYPGGVVPWGDKPFSKRRLWEFCHIGPQPVWRADLHDKIGLLDTSFSIAGDYELWCRMAAAGAKFVPVPLYLGLFYFDPTHNLSGSDGEHLVMENRRIRLRYRSLAQA